MEILYASDKLKSQLTNQSELARKYGKAGSKRLGQRLYDLDAAENLEAMRHAPGKCHELEGDHYGELAMTVDGGKRLIIEPADEPVPRKPDGGLDWPKVTVVRILRVEDYH